MCSLCWRHKVLQYKVLPDVLHKSWSGCNYVKMNEQKTQAIWLRTWQQVTRITEQTMTSSNDTIQFSPVVNDLGFLLDGKLTTANQFAALSHSCFIQSIGQSDNLWRQRRWKHCYMFSSTVTYLHYCNSLLGASNQLLHRMQVIQNSGARFITGKMTAEHTTPVLRELRWLLVWRKITYKTVYSCASACMAWLCHICMAALCTLCADISPRPISSEICHNWSAHV